MLRKRFGLVLAVVLGFVLLLSACGPAPAATNPAPAATPVAEKPKEPVTITFMTFSAAPDHLKDLDKIVQAFQAKNPDVKVQVDPVAYNDYFTKLQTAAAGGSLPDSFELNYENFVAYAKKGVLADMSALASADKAFNPAVYYPKAYQVFQYQGKQYGLVETFSTVVLFYNKDLFDKAGVKYPTADWKWTDEVEAAKKLTSSGVWGTFQPVQFWEFYKTIAANGGSIVDSAGKVVIDSPANQETLQYMIDKVKKYHVTPTDAEMGGQDDGALFKAGKIAMDHTGIWMFGAFKDVPFKWDIALEPGNQTHASHFFANAISISKTSKNQEAAWRWSKFLTAAAEAAQVRVDSGWELPAVADSKLVDGYLKQTPPASRQAVFDALNYPVVPPVLENWDAETKAVGDELDAAKAGKKSVAEALTAAKSKLEAMTK